MPQSSKTVIADTTCFILLDRIEELSILNLLFQEIYTTPEISREFNKTLPDWVVIQEAKNKTYQQILELDIDKGEASAIALALEFDNPLIILDDLKARKLSEKLNLEFTGTFGIILFAKKSGKIDSVKTILEKIRASNFRFSELVYNEILKEAGE